MKFPRRIPRHELRDELRTVLTEPGPYLSVYLNVLDHPLPPEARVEAALSDLDVEEDRHRAIVAAVETEAANDGAMLAAVASASGSVVTATFPDPPGADLVELGTLPRLAPFIEADQSLIHHVIGVIDDSGVSVATVPRQGEPVVESVSGGDMNAAATLIATVARRTDTALVLLCGPSTSLDVIHPAVSRSVPVTCPVARIDSDESNRLDPVGDLASDIVRMTTDQSARKVVEMMRLFRYQASHGAAVDGVVDSLAALADGRGGIVLLHADPADERQAWFGPAFDRIAIDIHDAAPVDATSPLLNARLVDVVLRSAIGQRLPVFVVPALPKDRLADGIGVICR